MKKLFLSITMALSLHASTAQTITNFAGLGTPGYSGDGGPATAAEFSHPACLALDHSGNMFVADHINNCVRRIDAVTGIVSTYAGTGIAGYSGDGGPATAATMYGPAGIVFDATDNMYVCELYGHVVRKVSPAGIISTFVGDGTSDYSGDGGPSTAARMRGPHGITMDAAGNIYIADYFDQRVRKVDPSGIISTVAGSGFAGFGGDGGPATDAQMYQLVGIVSAPDGTLYVVDQLNHAIRKVSTSGIISTYAGTPTVVGHDGDGGPATNAHMNIPDMVTLDAAGNLYIGEQYSNVTRMVNTAGIITTFAGTGVAGHSGDGGPATAAEMLESSGMVVDAEGYVYIADMSNNCIRRVGDKPVGIDVVNHAAIDCYASNNGDGLITLHTSLPLSQSVTVAVYDMAGRNVIDGVWNDKTDQYPIDLRVYPPGMYTIKLYNGAASKVVKVTR